MNYRTLGRTGWKVSEISFGAWAIGGSWGEVDDTESLAALNRALGIASGPVWLADGCNDAAIIELADEAAVRAVTPDFAALRTVPRMAVVTARGDTHDIVSRVFVPYLGIDEDPVTGSAHAALTPYWAQRLGRSEFSALQASARTGLLNCRLDGERVLLGGACHTVIVGQFQL